ncbi:Ask1p PWA37_000238 [Arxiozyma heterogenica]|uniref:DASH complex subunit ASK1 n=1 Tax=Arxiozyma heterogenica TaxID=278026 RepID=A0AAN7WFM1_9SACH|nr:hypothetical protein RI543_004172 [Kazachstania heterogenica]
MNSQLEQIDQEIIRYLQKIDINLNESFKIITQDIIPNVRKYGQTCDDIMDSCQWLITMFEQTSNVQLFGSDNPIEKNAIDNENERSIFPTIVDKVSNTDRNNINTNDNNNSSNNDNTNNDDDFHTANITTTGQILQLPEFSDDENDELKKLVNEKQTNNNNNSTLQRQNRKRKVSLLLQQQYGSNSSSIPSPVIQSKTRKVNDNDKNDKDTDTDINTNTDDVYDSSPLKNDIHNSTILQFPTAE